MPARSRTLYIGVTSDLQWRVWEHKHHAIPGLTAKYKIERFVDYEAFPVIDRAIAREKQLKRWSRAKKIRLIEQMNSCWIDLAEDWGKQYEP
jgi:putative endonuclease